MTGRPPQEPRRLARAASRTGAVVALVAGLAPAVAAQAPPGAPYAGLTVTAVRLEEQGQEITEAGLVALIETRPGAPLALLEVRDSIAHLFEIGRFEDIQVDARRDGAGVALFYRLIPLQSVARVEFEGPLGLPASRLRATLEDRFTGLPPVGRASSAARVLQDLYAGYGYVRATVVPFVRRGDAPGETVLMFDIDAGVRARLGAISVIGHPLLPPASLLDRLDLREGGDYDRDRLERALASYVTDLRSRGYYEASAKHDTTVAPDGTTIGLTLDVEAGPLVRVSFEGDPLPADRESDLVPVAREGSVDEDLLEDSDRRIEHYLHEQGYWKAQVAHHRTEIDGRLDIVFTVHRGGQYRVASIEVRGNRTVPEADLRPFVRIEPGAPFVASQLAADVAAIGQYYHRLGYARVKVDTAVEEQPVASGETALVTPRILITEGPRTLIGGIRIDGVQAIGEADLRAVMQSQAGQPYRELQVLADRDALTRLYLDRGYQGATVQVDPRLSQDDTSVDLVFTVREGPQAIVDHVIVVGNTRTSTATILRELPLKPGDPIGAADLIESRRRLAALGLFRRISITQLEHGAGTRRDLLVTVEEAPATSIGYGGGLEGGRRLRPGTGGGPAEYRLDVAPRGFFEIGRRNLWGKNRSVDLYSRLSMRQSDNVTDPTRSGKILEYRVVGTYREPRAFGTNADLLVNMFAEQGVRTSYNFSRKGVNGEMSKQLDPKLRLTGRYTFGYTNVFDERLSDEDKLLIDRLFPQVRLSVFASSLVRDTRDDALDPARGGWVSLNGELAARSVGSQLGFAKTYLQGFRYRRISNEHRVILALGARLGLATGFPRQAAETDAGGNPMLGPDGQPIMTTVKEVPMSERFFAGGDSTVRGFALDQLGTPDTIDQNGFPVGGNGLVLLNAELRLPVWRSVGVVGFVDAGNVFAQATGLSLTDLRGSVGFGLRYKSPIGPLRVDLGFKLDRRTLVSGQREPLTALHISFGQAF